jgi:hypothetical protein
MDSGSHGRYSAKAWEQTRREALEHPAAEAPPRQASSSHSPSTLVPGVAEMGLRGDDKDTLAIVASLRGAGFKVWVTDSKRHTLREPRRLPLLQR